MVLVAGRDRVEDAIDAAVGVVLLVHRGEAVRAGEPLVELHFRDTERLGRARELVESAYEIGDAAPEEETVELERIGS
jgi:thymidine phosphorylase